MTTAEFVKKYLGKELDWDNAYSGQCVDLFRFFCDEVLKIKQPAGVRGAGNFWANYDTDKVLKDNFTKIPNTADFIPKEGDVAIWNFNAGGGFGHIAVVCGKDHTTSYFHSFDQNWSKISYCEIVKHNYNNLFGVFRPKKLPEEDDMSDYEEAIRKSVAYDEVCKVLGVPSSTSKDEMSTKLSKLLSDKERYQKERNEARSERDNYAKENTGLNNQIALLKKDIAGLNEDLEKCKNEIPETGDLEKDWQATGRKIIKTIGDTIVEISYKRKDK